MPITIKNADVVIKLPAERLEAIKDTFEIAVADEATRIVLRTQQGKDVDGNEFAPYTPEYKKFRVEGRTTRTGKKIGGGRRGHPPDLTYTGNMMDAIQTAITRAVDSITATIFFASAREALKARGNQEKRPFFGLSDEQVNRITDKMNRAS